MVFAHRSWLVELDTGAAVGDGKTVHVEVIHFLHSREWSERDSPAPSVPIPYLMVKYQDLLPTFFAASVATILTVFLPFESFGEL